MVAKNKFNKIGIYSSKKNIKATQIASQIEEISNNLGIQILIPKSSEILLPNKKSFSDKYIIKNSDLIVAIGGDGTLLSSARKFGSHDIPILGINLGNLGFLTDIAPEELTFSFKEVMKGKFIKDYRSFINASILGSERSWLALNEVVVHSRRTAKLIEYELFIDEKFVYRQKADGIIISSPTGSTAYSLSGNGPIVHPEVKAITLLPMFPHSLNTRPLLVDENSDIDIKICNKEKVNVSFDSHDNLELKESDVIRLSKDASSLCLIHPKDHDFYSACRNKLGWSLGVPVKNYY